MNTELWKEYLNKKENDKKREKIIKLLNFV